jgi:hypothetical protein
MTEKDHKELLEKANSWLRRRAVEKADRELTDKIDKLLRRVLPRFLQSHWISVSTRGIAEEITSIASWYVTERSKQNESE